ncbi:CoA pyrophosphatase [Deinococcus metallilatus]|uniref:8-oxo-dGTP pyrophosphatase MutT (NUDIX family) n=1 Tax=Deinococcus metallilatus TaxID=1211322 RepID=A0AAJ5F0R9_9DEIO|nr:CoA pyrophosphatase [Deinococcus metallilatus]MBB5295249.1 8-oxo-dGTP pyrophosphatase MutT (NUDIX family) [Deinococcus metallilatus]QBY08590.1 CoA pyrophosphatase [Deinococcus metallilatus]RXJ10852.1 CoA pyrophosphatase [Deinococcus metallilatus]TLK22187.1 CoA pyrophosphatase [Deinococcus metallilatus]GMA15023.1 coenzyme A pyrophosphatase [Deinococcus metallilatus]
MPRGEPDPLDAALDDPWAVWLGSRARTPLHLPEYRRAAVLVALTREPDPRVLLTVRSADLPTHRGQISFPGGSLEPFETPVQGALREAEEEVGLDPRSVTVLGELDDVFTPVGFHVTPVLARVPAEPRLTLTAEVAQIITPTLGELRALPVIRETRILPDGQRAPLYRYPWRGHDIWGMTAKVLHDLLQQGP